MYWKKKLNVFFYFSVRFVKTELDPFSDLGILANENLVSKVSKEPFELGPQNFVSSLNHMCR